MEFINLKHDNIKLHDALGILVKEYTREEQTASTLRLKIRVLEDHLKLIFPNCLDYILPYDTEIET